MAFLAIAVTALGVGSVLAGRRSLSGAVDEVTSIPTAALRPARTGWRYALPTGVSNIAIELNPKRFELLSELIPHLGVIAFLVNPNSPNTAQTSREVEEAARVKGVQLRILKASTESEIDGAFIALDQLHVDGLVIGTDPFFNNRRDQLVALASRYAVPTVYPFRESAVSGGLISYGANGAAIFRQLGIHAGRILKGEKPADLPVQQPTKFELVINLKTAKVLGIAVPQSLLARADEVIE